MPENKQLITYTYTTKLHLGFFKTKLLLYHLLCLHSRRMIERHTNCTIGPQNNSNNNDNKKNNNNNKNTKRIP